MIAEIEDQKKGSNKRLFNQ